MRKRIRLSESDIFASVGSIWMVATGALRLFGLMETEGEYHYFSAATEEAKLMIDAEHPKGAA